MTRTRRTATITILILAILAITTATLFATDVLTWYGGLHTPNAGITTPWGGLELRGHIGFFGTGND